MANLLAPELLSLDEALRAADAEAQVVASGLSEADAAWRPQPASWSVAECLDHLATANRVYLAAMQPAAADALAQRRLRRRPALPGLVGRWFVNTLEPPVKSRFKMKAPAAIRPRVSPPLSAALPAFLQSQEQVRTFLRTYASIDLYGVTFPNPFIRGLRFSLATGLHVIAAHNRRHLWQARRLLRLRVEVMQADDTARVGAY